MKFECRELKDYVATNGIQTGPFGSQLKAEEYSFEGVPVVMPKDMIAGMICRSTVARVPESVAKRLKRHHCEEGDILLARRGDIGRLALVKSTDKGVLCGTGCLRVRPSQDVVPALLGIVLQQRANVDWLTRNAVGQTMLNLNTEIVGSLPVSLPPLPEQRKIADILTTWDEALTQLDALIEAQERRKKALMQQLLTSKKRFPGFKGKWKKVALGDVAENVADQNKGRMGTTSLYGVTKADGVVPMRDHVKGESFDRCKRVETDLFAYNPMRINIGSIARWQGAEAVMVSGDYVVFRCHPDKLLPAYLDHLRQSWMWQSFVTRGGNGSVRIRIYFSDLAEFTFPCPSIEEQRQIAALLDTADQQLTLLRTQRTALDQQKRGLMQRLLTGKLRVKP